MKISVVIITRNRGDKLKNCLLSLTNQSIKPDEVIVIDNDSSDNTKKTVLGFKKNLLIKYCLEKKIGIPYVRNRGLKEVNNEIISFTDDDCQANKEWIKEIKKSFKQDRKLGFLVGGSFEKKANNLFSIVTIANHNRWFFKRIAINNLIKDGSCFDTKNAAVRKAVIDKNKLKFSLIFSKYSCGEDTDFGMQLIKLNVKGIYNSKMKVIHDEPDSWYQFLNQAFRRGRANYVNRMKWRIKMSPRKNPPSRWQKWYKDWMMFKNRAILKRLVCFLLFKAYIKISLLGRWYEKNYG